jgi:hypothetical protein
MKKLFLSFFVAVLAAFAAPALADITFDPTTGTGFVGNGDVRQAFPELKNNAILQENIAGVTFNVTRTFNYIATCRYVTAEGTSAEAENFFTDAYNLTLNTDVDILVRTRKQATGIKLLGYAPMIQSTIVPIGGDACVVGGITGAYSSVVLFGSSTDAFINYNGQTSPLNWLPSI